MGYFFEGTTLSGGSGGGGDSANVSLSNLNSAGNGRFDAKANIGLDNLSSDGQMIIDSANGTISNCILEIPQNIKCEINGSTLTLKSGSILTRTGSTYGTFTLTQDNVWNLNVAAMGDDKLFMFTGGNGHTPNPKSVSRTFSGDSSSYPNNPRDGDLYFNTTDKTIHIWRNNQSAWETYINAYPFCVIEIKNHQLSFAKDSNGNDMIFNGAGFIGHHAFTNIQVKELASDGYNDDGSLKNIEITTNAFIITEMLANPFNALLLGNGGVTRRKYLGKFKTYNDVPRPIASLDLAYISNDNVLARYDGTKWVKENGYAVFVEYSYDGTIVTDFIIRQPYEGARCLLTDEIKEEVATKQADVTTLTGYDATKTQTLKNVNGVLTWVDDE